MRILVWLFAAAALGQTEQKAVLDEFVEFLRIPNVAADLPNIERNAAHLESMLARRGVKTQRLAVAGAPPVVFGELSTAGATRTLVFYAHYDGQSVDPREWTVTAPFTPLVRDGHLWARSASDDKGAIMAMLAALDRLRGAGRPLKSNIKFFFEGEEEAGSPNLRQIVTQHRARLAGDVWLICDGPVHQTRRQQVFFGARGITQAQITVYGPNRELHSGHYGNWAPNPAMMLARLLATMKDDEGHVLIGGWYDGIEPLSATEREAIAAEPAVDAALRQELGLARTDGDGRKLIDLINLPSLNIRGLASAATGTGARNVVPATATAEIDIRLVKGIDHRQAAERLTAHIRKQGYHVIDRDPDAATRARYPRIASVTLRGWYNAVRTPMDLPIAREVVAAIERARGPVVRMPTLGG
ncbi:MAG: M20/M25/M40 family metallo-hydrolase, partial [Bryobacteraceae bacterium]